jgi:DNA-directed RNA polymerase subunit RPC12/RpoP
MAKEYKCPNCGSPTIRKENGEHVCTNKECGGTFVFKEGEAHLTGVGEYEQLAGKVEKLEADQQDLRELLGTPDPAPDEPLPADDPDDPQPPEDPDGAGAGDEDDDDDEEDW